MRRFLRFTLLTIAFSVTAVPAAFADAPWSESTLVPGGQLGAISDLWFPASGNGVLTAPGIGDEGGGLGTSLAETAGDDRFRPWNTSFGMATDAIGGSGSQRFAIGYTGNPQYGTESAVARLTPAGVGRPFRVLPALTLTYSFARTPQGDIALLGRVSRKAKDRSTRGGIYLAVRRPGRGFSKPIKLAGKGGDAFLALAMNRDGRVLAAWDRDGTVVVRERLTGGRLKPARRIAADPQAQDLFVALAANGAAVVAWKSGTPDSSEPGEVRVALRGAHGGFRPAQTLAPLDPFSSSSRLELVTGVLPSGRIQLAWIGPGVSGAAPVQTAQMDGTTIGATQVVSNLSSVNLAIATGSSGEAVLAWGEYLPTGQSTLRAAVQRPGATAFDAPETVEGPPRQATLPRVAIDPATHRVVLAWESMGDYKARGAVFSTSRDPIR
jgi:hypothetical protein